MATNGAEGQLGKVAFVTGAASGIGRAAARQWNLSWAQVEGILA